MNKLLCGWRDKSLGLLLLRLGLGLVFFMHGMAKFQNLAGTVSFFEKLGIPGFFAYVVATVETVGGILMIIGLFTGIVGVLFAVIMLVAIITAKLGKGFMGFELEFMLLMASLAMMFADAGKYSVHQRTCDCHKGDHTCDTCAHKHAHVVAEKVTTPAQM